MIKTSRGFSLIEMAIVLVIVTILIGGLAVPLSAQIQARRIAETQKILEEAKEAIVGYAMTHKTAGGKPYLPCPDFTGNGVENRKVDNTCQSQSGLLPWVTLGVGNQDAWGNRLLYAAHDAVTNSNSGISPTVTPDSSWLQVCNSNTCFAGDLALNVPVVIASHGPNGRGARNSNSNSIQAAPMGTDELENKDGDIFYVSRTPYKPQNTSEANLEFDDLVTWISYNVLYPRVCPTGCP
jgi:prepilin-type N-terminal cleavage/methylation domain-containing protein